MEAPTDWTPERKIVGAAIAGLTVVGVQLVADVTVPPGTETMAAIVVGYFLPNRKG